MRPKAPQIPQTAVSRIWRAFGLEPEALNDPSNAAIPRCFAVRLREARLMRHRLRGAQDELRPSGQRFVSLVDADARLMRRAHGS